MFDHWVNDRVEMDDVLGKAIDPDSLARRIATHRRQMQDEEVVHPGEGELVEE